MPSTTIENDNILLFAVPKKGRLFEKVIKCLEGAGLDYIRPPRLDIAQCSNLPVKIVFLPAADIAAYVGEGKVDLGITGQDIVAESEIEVNQLELLGFGKCSLAVQAPLKDQIKCASELAGQRIVTSFPKITAKYFKKFERSNQPTNIKYVSGSVEAACALGLADGIVDLVETGTTMKAAGLEMVEVIMKSEAVLISNPHTEHRELVDKIHKRFLGYITANLYRMITYNIARSQLDVAQKITPGRKAPTINPLVENNYVSVSAMICKAQVADIMDELVDIGATDIVVFNLENCRA